MHLDEIVSWIDSAFGVESRGSVPAEAEALSKIMGSDGFRRYMKDQVNRQIIRDYLTNAVVLGEITTGGLAAFAPQLVSEESRATLALFMLMSSVEEAKDLPVASGEPGAFKPLEPLPKPRPHIKLVTS
ncbi:Uncharacterised protein [Halioglobus japonicus]|nr:Uncharacterised protein [Halioglobus japonicus]